MNTSELYFMSVGKNLEPNAELSEAIPTRVRDVPYLPKLNYLSRFFIESSEKLAILNRYVSFEIDSDSDKFFFLLPSQEDLALSADDFANLAFTKTLFGRASLVSDISQDSETMTLELSDSRFNTDGDYSLFRNIDAVLFSDSSTGAQFRGWNATKISDTQVEISLRPKSWVSEESVTEGDEFSYGGARNQLFKALNSGTFGTVAPSVSTYESFFDGDVEVESVGVVPVLMQDIASETEIAISPALGKIRLARQILSVDVTSDSGRFNSDLIGLTEASPFSGRLEIHFLTSSTYTAIFSDSLVYYGSRLRLFRPIDTRLSAPLVSIPSSAFTGVFVEGDSIVIEYSPSKICVAYGTLSDDDTDSGTFSVHIDG